MESPDIPEFPKDVFPPKLGRFIETIATSMQCDIKIPATFMLFFLSVMFQKSHVVKFKENFIDCLPLYFAVGASPASGKGRSLKWLVAPFREFEKEYQESQQSNIA
jgi:hypothetical protein